jgi:MbtH protein
MEDAAADGAQYRVVVNLEAQYSIWPASRDNPPGWSDEGKVGTKSECLSHIDQVWTDMRPLSLRRAMAVAGLEGNSTCRPT